MSRADEIRARVQRSKAALQDQTEESPRPATGHRVRTKMVRRTVDLDPSRHADLDAWCAETARQLGAARITGQAVLRALVARLLTDETLARKIRQDLARDQ